MFDWFVRELLSLIIASSLLRHCTRIIRDRDLTNDYNSNKTCRFIENKERNCLKFGYFLLKFRLQVDMLNHCPFNLVWIVVLGCISLSLVCLLTTRYLRVPISVGVLTTSRAQGISRPGLTLPEWKPLKPPVHMCMLRWSRVKYEQLVICSTISSLNILLV